MYLSPPPPQRLPFVLLRSGTTYGGAIFAHAANVTLLHSTIATNDATFGGGVYAQAASNVHAHNCTFLHNTGGFGAAISSTSGSFLHVDSSSFVGNIAGDGAAVYSQSAFVTLTASTLVDNSAAAAGAAIPSDSFGSVHGCSTVFNFTDVSISGGRARVGGNLALSSASSATLRHSNVGHGVSTFRGGCIDVETSTMDLHDVHIHHCTSQSGGGVAVVLGSLDVSGTSTRLHSNVVDVAGAAVFLSTESTARFGPGTVFRNNTAQAGGAVAVLAASAANFTDVVLVSSFAQHGAVLFIVGADARMFNSSAVHAVAESSGGFAHIDGSSNVLLLHTTLLDMKAAGPTLKSSAGGCVSVGPNVALSVINSTFHGCSSTSDSILSTTTDASAVHLLFQHWTCEHCSALSSSAGQLMSVGSTGTLTLDDVVIVRFRGDASWV